MGRGGERELTNLCFFVTLIHNSLFIILPK